MATALIALGSNLGDSRETVRRAVASLGQIAGISAVRSSRLYRTRPVGGPGGQREFVNAAAVVETSLAPRALWHALGGVEDQFGRTRGERWSARTLDLDLLLFDDVVLRDAELTLPHPRMTFRRFVLEPAAEVAADMPHPVTGCTIGELLSHMSTAPQYVAIGGLSRGHRTWLAKAICREVDASVLLETVREAASPAPSAAEPAAVPSITEVLEFVKHASEVLHRGYWSASPRLRSLLDPRASGSNRETTEPAVSDFWLEQWRLWACLYTAGAPAARGACGGYRRWFAAIEEYMAEIVSPKLVIWIDMFAALTPRIEERLPMCLDSLFRQPPRHAQLRLDGTDPDQMLAESLAAIEAMRPLEGTVS